MNPVDIILIAVIGAAVIAALIKSIKNFGKCNCGDGCGSCKKCPQTDKRN